MKQKGRQSGWLVRKDAKMDGDDVIGFHS